MDKVRDKVVAVVVTYNRRPLLSRCIAALMSQTRQVDLIVVINNNSEDDTKAYLDSLDQSKVCAIHAPDNLGGAGGFHLGIRIAMLLGGEFLWLMDDDGYPERSCLETTLDGLQRSSLDIANALVLADDNIEQLAFPINTRDAVIADAQQAIDLGTIHDVIMPFNGTLIRRSLIDRIGNIDFRFFIWGDEIEFWKRAGRHEAKMATICSARFFHPRGRTSSIGVPFLGSVPTTTPDRRGLLVRNRMRIALKYRGRFQMAIRLLGFAVIYGATYGPKSFFSTLRYGLDAMGEGVLSPASADLSAKMKRSIAVAEQQIQARLGK
ncbi:MAG: glycosyltransferase [Parvibaculum sp.]|uniref:glycosyltransferase n=1 Tax=Parvibaculum sp. TaxID=2024848 RepID=UPI003C772225